MLDEELYTEVGSREQTSAIAIEILVCLDNPNGLAFISRTFTSISYDSFQDA